jgi:hypothetical protein
MRPIGKPMDTPPYPGMLRARHFYPDGVADEATNLEEWKSPHRQLPGFGRLAYPQHGAGNQP